MPKAADFRVTDDGRIYRSGRKAYPNGDTYSVRWSKFASCFAGATILNRLVPRALVRFGARPRLTPAALGS